MNIIELAAAVAYTDTDEHEAAQKRAKAAAAQRARRAAMKTAKLVVKDQTADAALDAMDETDEPAPKTRRITEAELDAIAPVTAEAGTAHRADTLPPGFSRLLNSAQAEALRLKTLDDQSAGRADAAAKIAAKPARSNRGAPGIARQIKPATPAATNDVGPKPGTTSRMIFNMLRRDCGATASELTAIGLKDISVTSYARDFAKQFGLTVETQKDGRSSRCWLR